MIQRKKQHGFSLIELLIVFAIIGILTSVGLASYSTYSNTQAVQSSVADVLNVLSTAKSRAISQSKPTQCGTSSLTGYSVTIASPTYSLGVVCGGTTYVLKSQDLPQGVSFGGGTSPSITFAVAQGTSAQSTVILNGYGKTKTITVSSTGNIATN